MRSSTLLRKTKIVKMKITQYNRESRYHRGLAGSFVTNTATRKTARTTAATNTHHKLVNTTPGNMTSNNPRKTKNNAYIAPIVSHISKRGCLECVLNALNLPSNVEGRCVAVLLAF